MTFIDNTTPSQSESISFEFDLPHPPEKVWRALTEPDLLADWLLPAINLKLDRGSAFTFQANPQPGWDGKVHCRILLIEKPKKIVYTWVVGEMETVVTFTLVAMESGTRLSLVHSGFQPSQKKNFGGARYGWKMMGEKLIELLATMN